MNEYRVGDAVYELDRVVKGMEICPHCQASLSVDIRISGEKIVGYSNLTAIPRAREAPEG